MILNKGLGGYKNFPIARSLEDTKRYLKKNATAASKEVWESIEQASKEYYAQRKLLPKVVSVHPRDRHHVDALMLKHLPSVSIIDIVEAELLPYDLLLTREDFINLIDIIFFSLLRNVCKGYRVKVPYFGEFYTKARRLRKRYLDPVKGEVRHSVGYISLAFRPHTYVNTFFNKAVQWRFRSNNKDRLKHFYAMTDLFNSWEYDPYGLVPRRVPTLKQKLLKEQPSKTPGVVGNVLGESVQSIV